jgi:hypothetical protein
LPDYGNKNNAYFKCQKYEVGMQYLDKAVFYKDKNGFRIELS